jgi:hypothetical protein
MNTSRLFALSLALLFRSALTLHAATDIWDEGGGANDNISTNANWVDNTAPVSHTTGKSALNIANGRTVTLEVSAPGPAVGRILSGANLISWAAARTISNTEYS